MPKKLIPIVFLLFISFYVQAQHPAVGVNNQDRVGMTISLHQSQWGFLIPYWLTDRFVVTPVLGFVYFQKDKLDATVGIATRHYLKIDDISYYFGFRVGSMLLVPASEEELDNEVRSDLFAGATFGIEYFFARQFSVGMELQGSFIQSDERSMRFNNPGGFGFELAPVIMATFYF
ncbi:MAG: hypothetical protein ACOC12_00495 [Bacteroidota bacterium]